MDNENDLERIFKANITNIKSFKKSFNGSNKISIPLYLQDYNSVLRNLNGAKFINESTNLVVTFVTFSRITSEPMFQIVNIGKYERLSYHLHDMKMDIKYLGDDFELILEIEVKDYISDTPDVIYGTPAFEEAIDFIDYKPEKSLFEKYIENLCKIYGQFEI